VADYTGGHLLVATPVLHDPNFDRTVIFMLEHTNDGALGVVLSRPGHRTVGDAASPLAWLTGEDAIIFHGGPVSPEVAIAVGQCAPGSEGHESFSEIMHRVGTIDIAPNDRDSLAIERCRLFSGYSGWAPGQLEQELREKAWFIVELHPNDVFTKTPEHLWEDVLKRQPGDLAWYANYPTVPNLN
jgi:putative transcriptional regulator